MASFKEVQLGGLRDHFIATEQEPLPEKFSTRMLASFVSDEELQMFMCAPAQNSRLARIHEEARAWSILTSAGLWRRKHRLILASTAAVLRLYRRA